jgi:hypothetical protein
MSRERAGTGDIRARSSVSLRFRICVSSPGFGHRIPPTSPKTIFLRLPAGASKDFCSRPWRQVSGCEEESKTFIKMDRAVYRELVQMTATAKYLSDGFIRKSFNAARFKFQIHQISPRDRGRTENIYFRYACSSWSRGRRKTYRNVGTLQRSPV